MSEGIGFLPVDIALRRLGVKTLVGRLRTDLDVASDILTGSVENGVSAQETTSFTGANPYTSDTLTLAVGASGSFYFSCDLAFDGSFTADGQYPVEVAFYIDGVLNATAGVVIDTVITGGAAAPSTGQASGTISGLTPASSHDFYVAVTAEPTVTGTFRVQTDGTDPGDGDALVHWGGIDGTLSDQTDLQAVLDAKIASTRTISTTAPLTGGGDLSANRTLAITAATSGAAGSMSAADKTKLDAISGTNTGDQTNITGNAATATKLATARNIGMTSDVTWSVSFDGSAAVTAAATIGPNAVTNSKAATMAQGTFKMRAAASGTGDPIDGTPAQAKAALAVAPSDLIGLGTGVATALGVNVGSAGAVVAFNGAGGTPSSLTLTNATSLPISGLTASTSAALGIGSLELGHASDTTIARSGAGDITIEGNAVYRASGTDVAVVDGGTGRSTSTTAYGLIAAGTTATGAHQTLPAGATTDLLVGGGASALPVWTAATGSGAPVRAVGPTITGSLIAAGIRQAGSTAFVIENTFAALPTGRVGQGLEWFNTGVQSYDRSGAGSYGTFTIDGSAIIFRPSGSERARVSAQGLEATGSVKPSSYTVGTVPSASTHGAGALIYVSNESGGAVTAFSDGTSWRRVTDRAVIS